MHEQWTDQLSDYLDGELSADQRTAVEAHLRGCASCATVLDDLTRVIARAGSIEARPPQADLWTGIAARIETSDASTRVVPFTAPAKKRFAFTLPQLAAAAALLIAVSGSVVWRIAARVGSPNGLRSQTASGASTGATTGAPGIAAADGSRNVAAPVRAADGTGAADFARVEQISMADAQYDAAVADLEHALKAGRGRLDASTITIVEHNLQIIDQAINQAREALAGDPANSYLSSHLVEARRRKLDLLRRATALATETN
ncbi:MAG: hypothetical protein JWL71_86 [Acidobacteria bacterium]|nr:hypothetical protein [Acidobacteriota bacterium]